MADIASRWKLAVVIGSTREGRFGPTVANWFMGQVDQYASVDVDLIDLADTEMPRVHPDWGAALTPSVAALGERLAQADAFVIVTPEYNHGYPASLKQAIDLFTKQWQAKPVAFVSYGGMGGGLRSVHALRPILPSPTPSRYVSRSASIMWRLCSTPTGNSRTRSVPTVPLKTAREPVVVGADPKRRPQGPLLRCLMRCVHNHSAVGERSPGDRVNAFAGISRYSDPRLQRGPMSR